MERLSTWATASSSHADEKMNIDQPFPRDCWLKCCQKCCAEKHVDLPASRWVYDTSKQHISEAAEVVEHHANFKSVNAACAERQSEENVI